MKKIYYKIAFVAVLGVAFCGVVFSDDTFAGGWISGDAGESSYDGGPGGEWHNCSNIGGSYLLECTGFSWVFYKSTGNIESSIYFRPDLSSNRIDKVCSEHTDQNGGFWHFGRNARGIPGDGYNKQGKWQTFNYFGDFDYVNNYYDTNARVTYSTGAGNWGHMETLNYRLYGSYGSSYYKTPTSLNHTIYVDGKAIYNAQKYGTIGQVLSDYKKAYKYVTGNDYTGNGLPGDMYAFCYWDDMAGDTFEGTSRVLKEDVSWSDDMVGAGTGVQLSPLWKPDNTNANSYTADNAMVVNDCDPVDGCSVVFRHYMKRVQGGGESKYSVSKSVNGSSSTVVSEVATSGLGTSGKVMKEDTVTMYPGQKVCETLNFYAKGDSGGTLSSRTSTTVCAAAVVTVGSSIDIQIRDQQSSSSYDEYGKNDNIYTKPTDTVDLKGVYNPAYRSMYNISLPAPSKTNNFPNNGSTIGATFNANFDPDWNNKFSINLDNKCSSEYKYYIVGTSKFPAGRPAAYDGEVSYVVGDKDVGKTIKAQATTNVCDYTKNTPKQVSLTYSDGAAFTATVDTGENKSKEVSFAVPYNFSNSTSITSSDTVVYAGESATINYTVNVGTKTNNVTNGTYATQVPGARWGLRVSYDGGLNWGDDLEFGNGELNGGDGYDFRGKEEQKGKNTAVNIPDIAAGSRICFQSWVYPADSGGPMNLSTSGFSGTSYSKSVCFTIAKKPSFQVWGGSVYSAKNVNIPVSSKVDLAGKTTYSITGGGNGRYIFGSWTELGLVAGGTVNGLASGAGSAYQSDNLDGAFENNEDYCLRSTLSFANTNCKGKNGIVGGLGTPTNIDSDKSSLIARFINNEDKEGITYIDLKDNDTITDTITSGTTVYYREGDIKITNNLTYNKDAIYTTLTDIPKTIIYATNDILISCNVEQIDAILIAKNNVNTCADTKVENGETKPISNNNKARSNQLRINGSIITNTLTLGRTYGAATGNNSIVPAEIINYDTSLYLWSGERAGVTQSGELTETDINEMAPRY